MTRPAQFSDQHTLARQKWLQDLQFEACDDQSRAMQMLVACIGWGFGVVFAIVIGLAFADWVSGEYFAAKVVATWRART